MSNIRLDFLKSRNIDTKRNDSRYADDTLISIADNYTYKDLYLDLSTTQIHSTKGLNANPTYKEIKTSTDVEAIVSSVKNILQTVPGEKLLNPQLGINLVNLLFQPITLYTGRQIAQSIAVGLQDQEPRVKIENVHCTGYPELNQYLVSINVTIPTINNTQLSMTGIISVNGIIISNIDNETIN